MHSQLAKMESEYVITSVNFICDGMSGDCTWISYSCLALFYSLVELNNNYRLIGSGGSRGFARTPFWPPKDFIYTA